MYDGLRTIDDVDLTGKRVLLRVAYDVPIRRMEDGGWEVEDDTRIRVTVPTIQRLLEAGCSIVICGGWLGRPNGTVDPALRMDPVAARLYELLCQPIQKLNDCVGPSVSQAASRLQPGEIVLLENTRFHPEESANDPAFAQALASLGELCVFDAFAQAHRDHASTTGLVSTIPTVLGPLMVLELTTLHRLTEQPVRPFVVVLGGKKIVDKIALLRRLVDAADQLLIGGALANAFLKAQRVSLGRSVVESMDIDHGGLEPLVLARELLERAGNRLVLPSDFIVADRPDHPTRTRTVVVGSGELLATEGCYDLGPATRDRYRSILASAATIFWNGTLGVDRTPEFAAGTRAIAEAVGANRKLTVVGGGDTADAVRRLGLSNRFTHVSTGGGASLAVVSGEPLAVLTALKARQP